MAEIQELLDGMPDGIVIVDSEGTIIEANEVIARMTGFTAVELVGRSVEDLVPPDQRGAHANRREGFSLAPVMRPMNTGIDTRLLLKDGSDMAVEIQISPIQWGGRQAFIASVRQADAS